MKLDRQDYGNVMRNQMVLERLRAAIGRRDRGMLERAIKDATVFNVVPDNKELRRAKELIRVIDQKERLRSLLSEASSNLSEIQQELANIEKSKFLMSHLQRDFQEAKLVIDGLVRFGKMNTAILDMDSRTMSEVRRYHNPPEEVAIVMRATLLLLGEDELTTGKWTMCLTLMTPTGPEGMKRKILDLDMSKLHPEVVSRVRQMLEPISLEVIQPMSKGAATFYVWAMSVVEEYERTNGKGGKPADVDLQRKFFGKPRRRLSPSRKYTTYLQPTPRGTDATQTSTTGNEKTNAIPK